MRRSPPHAEADVPIALLLQETIYSLRWGADRLSPWQGLVDMELALIDRARSAFLFRWFGPGLPLLDRSVRFVIDNLAAFRARYLAVQQSVEPGAEGPNLLEPLAGIAGTLAGILSSPTGTLLVMWTAIRKLGALVQRLGWKVAGLPLLPAVGPVLAGLAAVALPLLALGAIEAGLGPDRDPAQVYRLLGATAVLLIAVIRFLDLLNGPRERIKNPLLRRGLELLDAVAGFVPFALAFVSILFARVGPLLPPLLAQRQPFSDLAGDVADTVLDIGGSIKPTLKGIWPTIADRIDFITVQLIVLFQALSIVLQGLFQEFGWQLTDAAKQFEQRRQGWTNTVRDQLGTMIADHWLMRLIQSAKLSSKVAEFWLTSPSEPKKESPPRFTSPEKFQREIMGRPPAGGLDAITLLAEIDAKHGGALFGHPLPFGQDARAGLRALRPTHVFDAERNALTRSLGQSPARRLAALRAEQFPFRDTLFSVVGTLLPPLLRSKVDDLRTLFDTVDEKLYGADISKQPDFPVQDLADNGLLRPTVRKLTVRAAHLSKSEADDFGIRLRELLLAQIYPVEAPAAALAVRGR